MHRLLIFLVAALMVYLTPDVAGAAHLSFSNDTQVNITRDGCGVTKLCVETPNDCDPAGNTNCLFASVVAGIPAAPNGTVLSVKLRGDSVGYIALGLTVNASEKSNASFHGRSCRRSTSMLFICAQNSSDNGTFFFRTMLRHKTDNTLHPSETRVDEIRGTVKGSVIQCEFNIPDVNSSNTRTDHVTTFSVLLGTGRFDSNVLSPFNISLETGFLNLADPTSNIATTAAPSNITTATNATESGSSRPVHPHAVLLLLIVLTLSIMLRA